MNKITKQTLNNIICNFLKVKKKRVKLISEYKRQRKEINNDYTKDNKARNRNFVGSDSSHIRNMPVALNEAKPKPKKAYHLGSSKYDITRRRLYNWIASSVPTHFLTVQFPVNMRSSSLDKSKDNLRRLMARFEQSLIGSRWAKAHLPFFVFAEKGPKDGYTYHFHILFNASKYSTATLRRALNNACSQLFLSHKTCYLEEIETYEIIYYCLKDIKISNRSGSYDTIILSSDLFDL